MVHNYLKRKGDPRPIGFTIQEIAMVFLSISVLFMAVLVNFPNNKILELSTGIEWYIYDFSTLAFLLILSFMFAALGMIFICFSLSKNDLNMWTDRVNKDWQATLRVDKNGLVSNQIMKKDSLGFVKGIAFGKKAGLINKGGFKLTLPNGNTVLLVLDFMSHNANPLEAVGWSLYKKKHGVIGYNAYKKCQREKKTLLSINDAGRDALQKEIDSSRIGETIVPKVGTESGLISVPAGYHKEKKKRWHIRRRKKE